MSANQSLTVAIPVAPLSDVLKMADVVAASKLFPAFSTPQAAAALMLLCRAKNLDPMTAVERYHIVQGRPVMRADAMLGDFLAGGGRVEWHERTGEVARATFSHPQGGQVEVEWTMAMAKAAKLTGKDVWLQYPRQMLHARCVSEGVRSVYPSATNGLYTPEEAENMEPIRATVEAPRPAAPAPAIEQAKARPAPLSEETRTAMEEFGDVAERAKLKVRLPNALARSPRMMRAAASELVSADDQNDDVAWLNPGVWERAKTALVEKLAATSIPETAPAQPMKRTTPEPPVDDIDNGILADPFADN
jgi:hypothetical protein